MGLEIRKDHQVMAMTKKHVDADDAGYGGDDLVLYVDADNHDKLDEHMRIIVMMVLTTHRQNESKKIRY